MPKVSRSLIGTEHGFRRASAGPTVAVLAAAALFGTTGTALAKGPYGIDSVSAGTLRLLIGGTSLCLISSRALSTHARTLVFREVALILLGGFAVACYQIGFFWATQSTGVALATVVTIGSSPLVARTIGVVRSRPAPFRWWGVSAVVVILGLVILVAGSATSRGGVDVDPLGVLCATVAGASYACYTEVGSELMVRGWSSTPSMAAMFFSAGVITAPLLLIRDVSWVVSASGSIVILYLSLVTLTVAYIWFGWGLRSLSPTTVVTLTMAEPVIASILAVVVLDESLSGTAWIGLAMVLIGLSIVGLGTRSEATATVGR